MIDENSDNIKWLNPYINKLDQLQAYVIKADSQKLNEAEIIVLQQKCSLFQDIYCEIGSGSGKHLIELAKKFPDKLCIGFELRFKRAYKTAEKAAELDLNNVLVIRSTAFQIPNIFKTEQLSGVFVNFPDPWQKRRWQKNRIVSINFLGSLINVMQNNSFLSYKTDHQEYFQSSLKLLKNLQYIEIIEESFDLHSSEFLINNIKTEFEGLFCAQKLPIYYTKALFKK
jgi:tRNA (guanine-N7-)-methyltransferase